MKITSISFFLFICLASCSKDNSDGNQNTSQQPATGELVGNVSFPQSLQVDKDGNIYVAAGGSMHKFNPNGVREFFITGLVNPTGLAIDTVNNLIYFSDRGNKVIRVLRKGAGYPVLNDNLAKTELNPGSIFLKGTSELFICTDRLIEKWSTNGTYIATLGNRNEIITYDDIFVDASGSIYTAEANDHRVRKWAPDFTSPVVVAGGRGQGSADYQLNNPTGVYVDLNGDIYVADMNNNRVQKWKPGATSGITVAGGSTGGSTLDKLLSPKDIWVDKSSNLYIADRGNSRIVKWKL